MRRVLASAVALACQSCRPTDPTALVVGIQSDRMGGVVSALHVVIRVAGEVVEDDMILPSQGSKVVFPQRWERTLSGAGKGAARVDVEVDAIGDPAASAPLVQRLSSTHFVPGKVRLLRIPLESRCIVHPQTPRGMTRVPGLVSGRTCNAPTTCISGICQLPDVPAGLLEPYPKNWPSNTPDPCKPRNGGRPDLQVGVGRSDYLPIPRGQMLQAEAGLEGHHIWIATRMQNLRQTGSITKISGVQPDTGVAIPPTTLAFAYSPDEAGHCELDGIRLQLDNDGIDYKPFLGKPLDVNVTVTDPSGSAATATMRVEVAPSVSDQDE